MTTETETAKVCKKCQIAKPTTEFYRESKGAGGSQEYRCLCRACWLGHEPEVTEDERKQFVEQFVLNHLRQHGETADEFFRQWLNYKYPEITQEAIGRVIGKMTGCRRPLKVTRQQVFDGQRIKLLALS
jgi:hypothetical protein